MRQMQETALAAAEGRMKVKAEQAIKAVEAGVGKVIDARRRPVSRALAAKARGASIEYGTI